MVSNMFHGNILERYKEMTEIIDHHYLFTIVEERLKNTDAGSHSFEEVLAKDGLTLSDIEVMEYVEIE